MFGYLPERKTHPQVKSGSVVAFRHNKYFADLILKVSELHIQLLKMRFYLHDCASGLWCDPAGDFTPPHSKDRI